MTNIVFDRVLSHWQDSPDTFNVSTEPEVPHNRDFRNVSIGHTTHDRETFRVRNNPHLYDDWQVDMVDEQRAAYIERLERKLGTELVDWDCHKCRSAVISRADTYTVDTKCPKCHL